jgi:HEAT repeat protein
MIPLLLERLPDEPDYGLQVTYASALGKLGAGEATDALLPLLADCDDETVRMELALAVARTVGPEDYFIRLLRQVRGEAGTALAQALGTLRRKMAKAPENQPALLAALDAAIDALARNELTTGAQRLQQLIEVLPVSSYPPSAAAVLQDCAMQLGIWGERRMEYLLLVAQTLHGV